MTREINQGKELLMDEENYQKIRLLSIKDHKEKSSKVLKKNINDI